MTESEDTDMSVLEKGIYKKDRAAYETLTLKNENCSLTVCPEKGGMIISFKKGNEEYIWLRDGNFEKDERPRCGIPILFPNCGMPDNGVHVFAGKPYPIENHGIADLLPWKVAEATDEHIVLELTPNGLTKFVYPFDFRLSMEYTLKDDCAGLSLTVENTGGQDMPYSVGFHPYFTVSDVDNVSFDIHADTYSDHAKGEQPAAPAVITLPRNPQSDSNIRFLTGIQNPMVFKDAGNGHTVTVSFDENFRHGVLWEQEAESFVCMEPWNGWANSLNEEGRHETAKPGEKKTFLWHITIA